MRPHVSFVIGYFGYILMTGKSFSEALVVVIFSLIDAKIRASD